MCVESQSQYFEKNHTEEKKHTTEEKEEEVKKKRVLQIRKYKRNKNMNENGGYETAYTVACDQATLNSTT